MPSGVTLLLSLYALAHALRMQHVQWAWFSICCAQGLKHLCMQGRNGTMHQWRRSLQRLGL